MTTLDRRAGLLALPALFAAAQSLKGAAKPVLMPAPMVPPINHTMPSDMGRGDGVHWMGDEEIAMLMYRA